MCILSLSPNARNGIKLIKACRTLVVRTNEWTGGVASKKDKKLNYVYSATGNSEDSDFVLCELEELNGEPLEQWQKLVPPTAMPKYCDYIIRHGNTFKVCANHTAVINIRKRLILQHCFLSF